MIHSHRTLETEIEMLLHKRNMGALVRILGSESWVRSQQILTQNEYLKPIIILYIPSRVFFLNIKLYSIYVTPFHLCFPFAFKRFSNISMFLAPPVSVFQIMTNPLVSLTNIVHRIFRCSTVTDKNGEAHKFCLKNNLPYKDSQCCIYGILIIDKQKQVHKV